MHGFILGFLLASQVFIIQCKSQPDWITREPDVWVEKGIIYSRGSAKLSTQTLTLVTAETRARSNITRAVARGEISGFLPIPSDIENRSTFNYNGIKGELGRTVIVENFIAKDGTGYVLISCIGAELDARLDEE